MSMVLTIDFDGTMAKHVYPKLGEPVPGAIEWIRKFIAFGAKVVLLTMRDGKTLEDAVAFCKTHGIELFGVNENPEQDWSKSRKVYGNLDIDDNNAGCPLAQDPNSVLPYVDWNVIGPFVLAQIQRRVIR